MIIWKAFAVLDAPVLVAPIDTIAARAPDSRQVKVL